jgi:HlyD family secretion protein
MPKPLSPLSSAPVASGPSALLRRTPSSPPFRPHRSFHSWLLPAAILAGFVILFALLFQDRLLPATPVRVIPAIALAAAASSATDAENAPSSPSPSPATGRLLFQASGWIEPDPLPIRATALVEGVVEEVLVLEGQTVQQGEILARLIQTDARLMRHRMREKLAKARADLDAHCTGTQVAIQKMEIAKAELAAESADLAETADRLVRLQRTPEGAVPASDRVAVHFLHDRRKAAVAARRAAIEEIAHDMNRIAYETLAMQHEIRAMEIDLAEAELALERTEIRAPLDGIIQTLFAAPGRKIMLVSEDMESATVATLYQADKLQVRVDVPLADAAGLSVGQPARIRCSLLGDSVFDGEVTRITGQADIQRNTLQAKVRILNPDPRLRPEMLCRVEFLATATAGDNPASTASAGTDLTLHVPENALQNDLLWICDAATLRVRRVSMQRLGNPAEGWQAVQGPLLPGEWVVLQPAGLRENQRVRPTVQTHHSPRP